MSLIFLLFFSDLQIRADATCFKHNDLKTGCIVSFNKHLHKPLSIPLLFVYLNKHSLQLGIAHPRRTFISNYLKFHTKCIKCSSSKTMPLLPLLVITLVCFLSHNLISVVLLNNQISPVMRQWRGAHALGTVAEFTPFHSLW